MTYKLLFPLFLITLFGNFKAQEKTQVEAIKDKKQLNFKFVNSITLSPVDSVELLVMNDKKQSTVFHSGNTENLTIFIESGTYFISLKRKGFKEKSYKTFNVPEDGVGIFRISLIANP